MPTMRVAEHSELERTLRYHERTKHHFNRFARSLGRLDWANQPSPFRKYEGTQRVPLPLPETDPSGGYLQLYDREMSAPSVVRRKSLGAFLGRSVGLSAWKSTGEASWALRINPSSGNLHPTEVHLLLPSGVDIPGGVYHYAPYSHELERRADIPADIERVLHAHFTTPGFLVGLTSILWRESWKYGERAFRYCNHDIGHALACLSYSAALLGWRVVYLGGVADTELESLFGLSMPHANAHEKEHPELLCFVDTTGHGDIPRGLPEGMPRAFGSVVFHGAPSQLSPSFVEWDIIDEVAESTRKPRTEPVEWQLPDTPLRLPDPLPRFSAAHIITHRRSAVQLDGVTSITKHQFLCMLDKTLPRRSRPPFDVGLGCPSVHLLVFVHRVRGLSPGVYFLLRNERDGASLQEECHAHFLWERVERGFPLHMLTLGNCQDEATQVSCGQDIAGDGAFSVGMIARFEDELSSGTYHYRRLFWETGLGGQALYLEAEAHGVRGTGIGCYFDDPVHDVLGITTKAYQSLYHFTVGGPVSDSRLTTLPAYHHLDAAERR